MSAGPKWIGEARGDDRGVTAREPREPLDLDRLVEVATTVGGITLIYGGVVFYLGGAATLAYLLGGWVGALVLAVFGIPPMAYALAKWNRRKADRDIRTDARHTRETASGSGVGYDTFK